MHRLALSLVCRFEGIPCTILGLACSSLHTEMVADWQGGMSQREGQLMVKLIRNEFAG
jgi:hypothetical protein